MATFVGLSAGCALALVGVVLVLAVRRLAEDAAPRSEVVARPAPRTPPRPTLRLALGKSRGLLLDGLSRAFGDGRETRDVAERLEELLVSSDVGIPAARALLARLSARGSSWKDEAELRRALRDVVEETLSAGGAPVPSGSPWVILVTGVNGVGKTTSIAKLARRHQEAGRKVLLVAADTFRAGAIEQLGIWAERIGVEIVRHQAGSDPAAVAFDGVKAARARGVDVVLVDTAGRLHTRQNLMDELRKVTRVLGREVPDAPQEAYLVLDATTGRNAVAQAKVFTEAVGITGVILTKLDGTAKGGAALAVREELGLPILYAGIGEGLEDLRPFSAREFADALVGTDA